MADPKSPEIGSTLTERQREVWELLAKGLTNAEIGDVLGISPGTVKIHVSRVIAALEVTNRTEAAMARAELEPSMSASDSEGVGESMRVVRRPAIAVVPFESLSSDPEHAYLADGLVEDLVTRLSYWRWFPVISRSSTRVYAAGQIDVQQVSRDLGARYIVQGSVRHGGDRVRVAAQLVDATSGDVLWANRYDREIRDLFELQDELAETLVLSIEPALNRSEQQVAARGSPERLDAWSSTQRGLSHIMAQTREGLRVGQELIERACELDPDFGPAFSSLAVSCGVELAYGWGDSPERTIARGLAAAGRAVELDPDDAVAHTLLATAVCMSGERERGRAMFARAVALNPSLPGAHHGLGMEYRHVGRLDEAAFHLEHAIRLSPHDFMIHAFLAGVGTVRLMRGELEQAVEAGRRSVEVKPDDAQAHLILATAYCELGRIEAAQEELGRFFETSPPTSRAYMAIFDPEPLIDRYAAAFAKLGHELVDA
ncbi:MAG: LuxR C-terminal-related transcriptional regulator [Myxococcota bacterium]|nr:LuxR C-terminal-related transcriptional regulator [Myxococcota bacterium]